MPECLSRRSTMASNATSLSTSGRMTPSRASSVVCLSSVTSDVLDTPTQRTFTSPSARWVETLKSAMVGFNGILTVWYITSG